MSDVTQYSKKLSKDFPNDQLFKELLINFSDKELMCFIRSWLSEGIPCAFEYSPMLFEIARECLAEKLMVHPKQITLIGSGRSGYSLSPSTYGMPFSTKSDLDFSVISYELFEGCVNDFNKWRLDFDSGIVQPSNSREEAFWSNNLIQLPKNISRGFIDHYKIPLKYEKINSIQKSLFILRKKISRNGLENQKISLRVYKDWQAFCNQNLINLKSLIASLKNYK